MSYATKSQAMKDMLEEAYGTGSAIATQHCIRRPMGCGQPVAIEVNPDWTGTGPMPFRNEMSLQEYQIGGMCQACQDAFYEWSDDE